MPGSSDESLSRAAIALQSVFLKEQDLEVEMTPSTGLGQSTGVRTARTLPISITAPGAAGAVSASARTFPGTFLLSGRPQQRT